MAEEVKPAADGSAPNDDVPTLEPITSGPDGDGRGHATLEADGRIGGCGASVFGLPLQAWDSVVIILLTIVADICLYEAPGGAGTAALILVTAIGLMSLVPGVMRRSNALLFLAVLLIAARSAWDQTGWLGLAGALSAGALAIQVRRPDWRCTEVAWALPSTALFAPFKLVGHGLRFLGHAAGPGAHARKRVDIRARVIVIPLLVCLLFVILFARANPVVERLVDEFSDWLGKMLQQFLDLFSIPRMFTWVFWLLVFAALIRPTVRSWIADSLAKRPETLEKPEKAGAGEFSTALTTLLAVNVVFLAFNALDSVYLYFRAALPAGISYSEYSHRGCIWLTLALACSTVAIGVVFKGRQNFTPGARVLRGLSYIWAIQNGILAVGVLRRLQMYIDYNGMTRLRIVGIYGVLLVAAGLVLMVWKVRRAKNFTWLVRRDLLAFWVAFIVLALTPRDYISWRYNAAEAMSGNLRPFANLVVQPMSPESFPPMIPLIGYRDPSGNEAVTQMVRKGMASLLLRELGELQKGQPANWTQWQGSSAWALGRLKAAEGRLRQAAPPAAEQAEAEQKLREHVRQWL